MLYFERGGVHVLITATEFKTNIGKYLAFADKEDVIITKNGKAIAKLTSISEDRVALAKSLFGILPSDASIEQAREERLSRHERAN
jgi:prevent-host-death family protein